MTRGNLLREIAGAAVVGTTLTVLIHLTPPSFLQGVDWLQLHLPARQFMAQSLRAGLLPVWNPHVSLGRPFLADLETAVFYPPNLSYVLLDVSVAYVLVAAAHAALAVWGMVQLGRHLLIDERVSWMLGALFVSSEAFVSRLQVGQTHYVHAIAYLPLLLLLAARVGDRASGPRVLALSVTLALQLLCGHPQIAWLSWLGLSVFVVARSAGGPGALRRMVAAAAGFGVSLVAALCLAAPTLLPFFELVGQGNRTTRTLESAGAGGMTAFLWSSLAVPDAGARVFQPEYNLYTGLGVLAGGLAGLAATWRERNTRGLTLMAVTGVVFAFGAGTPLFAAFHHLVPGASVFRFPARAAVLPVLALVVGLGLLLSRRLPARVIAASLGIAAVSAAALTGVYRAFAPAGLTTAATGLRLGWLLVTLGLLAAVMLSRTARGRLVGIAGVAALLAADIGTALPGAKAAWVLEVRHEEEPLIRETLRRWGLYDARGVPPRVAIPPQYVRENSGSSFGWSNVAGYQAVSLTRTWRYLHDALGVAPPAETTFPSTLIYAHGPFPYDSMNIVAGVDESTGRLVARRDPDPRAYLATAARPVEDFREAIRLMKAGHDFHRVALVERAGTPPLPAEPGSAATGRAEITTFAADRLTVRTEAAVPGLLVLSEPWYPGWEARVDGQPVECEPANAWMRAVRVPAGSHEVALRFRVQDLAPGIAISAMTLLGLGIWALRDPRRLAKEDA